LKEYLTNPPLLSRPTEGEILYLYLAVSPSAVSSTLVREDSGIQKPVYFTSKALHGAEERYPRIEKLAFALVISARRLRPYFQAHAIRVLTEYPMKKVLQKLDLSGRLVNWAMELGQFDIEFHPRTNGYQRTGFSRFLGGVLHHSRSGRTSKRINLGRVCGWLLSTWQERGRSFPQES